MFDPERLLGQMIGGTMGGAFGGGRGRRKSSRRGGDLVGKAQLGIGLLGIAMAAWEHYRQAQPAPTPVPAGGNTGAGSALPPPAPGAGPLRPPPPPPANPDRTRDMALMVQAMIAAAAADGAIDAQERERILARSAEAGLDAETQAFLQRELTMPRTLEQIVAAARPALARDLYAASLIAISADTEAERAYLDRLAQGLGLAADARTAIHQQLAQPL